MTPAIRELIRKNIEHKVHVFDHDPSTNAFALEAANALSIAPARLFKTLVLVTQDKTHAIALAPMTHPLSLKKAARVLGTKKCRLADAQTAMRLTGYLIGGISPLAQKQALPTLIDKHAFDHMTVFVSGGQRGVEIEIRPAHLVSACHAEVAVLIEA